jgi:hypothetical protein
MAVLSRGAIVIVLCGIFYLLPLYIRIRKEDNGPHPATLTYGSFLRHPGAMQPAWL